MNTLRILLLAFFLSVRANACLWVEGTTMEGRHRTVEGFPASMLKHSLAESPEHKIDIIMQRRQGEPLDDFSRNEIDGVREVLHGNYDRAIDIFGRVETEHPGRYSTAANLGTAYELKGELELALKWISEGIRRNPESHYGTEWLHVEILKIRMKLKENPGYLRQNHVITLPDSYSAMTAVRTGENTHTIDQIADSVLYQLEERMIFVKPPDPVVADLLFTLGMIEGRINVVESGIKLFELANDYGFANTTLIRAETERFEQAIRYAKIKRTTYIVLAIATFILFLIFAWRKKWFFLTRAAYLKHRIHKHLHPEI